MCGGKDAIRDIKFVRSVSKEDETPEPIAAEQLLELRKKKYGKEYMGILRDYAR